ncbi:MAG: hypothetical protein ACU841_17005 [Gammaproteobacteria bacterium]
MAVSLPPLALILCNERRAATAGYARRSLDFNGTGPGRIGDTGMQSIRAGGQATAGPEF